MVDTRQLPENARVSTSDAMMREYYERRAPEYESTYERPERQSDLSRLRRAIARRFEGRSVLDIACGTGYWTACFAAQARQVLGLDANPAVLDVARGKALARTRFVRGDAYHLPDQLGRFDAAFIGFWWSHVPRRELADFVGSLHRLLLPGARIVILDNLYVPGSSTPVSDPDAQGDCWQERLLSDGSRHRVLKNFPRYEELLERLGPSALQTHWWQLDYYWWFEYVLR